MAEPTTNKTSKIGFLGFIVSTVKIALAITLSILILAVIGIGVVGISVYQHRQQKQPYAEPTFWEEKTIDTFEDTTFSLIRRKR